MISSARMWVGGCCKLVRRGLIHFAAIQQVGDVVEFRGTRVEE